MQLDAVLLYLAAVTQVDTTAFTPLLFAGEALGCVNAEWKQRLLTHEPDLFVSTAQGLSCCIDGDYAEMSYALNQAALRWRQAEWLNGWRDENFLARHLDGSAFFELERAAFRPLGLTSHAVHLNGLTRSASGEVCMWLGRRSPFKAVDPNRMDNMVGGGVAAGESIDLARARESWEEAGLPAELVQQAEEGGVILAKRPVVRGLHCEWLHVYDLWLDPLLAPHNQDGEVAEHLCVPLATVESLIVQQRFMIDAALVAADCLARLGYWGPDGLRVRAALAQHAL